VDRYVDRIASAMDSDIILVMLMAIVDWWCELNVNFLRQSRRYHASFIIPKLEVLSHCR
jgi:hypothetical protein